MAPIKYILVMMFVFLIIAGNSKSTSIPEEINLKVGENKKLKLPGVFDLHVSRRGVIDIQYLGREKWSLTALQRGFVVLYLGEKGRTDTQRIFIRSRKPKPSKKLLSENKPLPSWLCLSKGVRCRHESGLVSGSVDDYNFFFKSWYYCHERQSCFFKMQLSHRGFERLKIMLKDRYPERLLSIQRQTSYWLLEVYCSGTSADTLKKSFNSLFHKMVSRGRIIIRCSSFNVLKVKIRIMLTEKSRSTRFGLDKGQGGSFSLLKHKQLFFDNLQDIAEDNKVQTIASPWLHILAGEKSTLSSGGEVAFFEQVQGKPQVKWKNYGLKLTIIARRSGKNKVSGQFDFQLSHPKNGKSAHSGMIKISLVSPFFGGFSQDIVLGGVDISGSIEDQLSRPLLQKIPIIGYWLSAKSAQKNQLYATFILNITD